MNKKWRIEDMNNIAKQRNGECLSTIYVRTGDKLLWKCKEGHEWLATPNKVLMGKWCPKCAGKNKTIEDMQRVASERGGICLSEKYEGVYADLVWQCKEGHVFNAKPTNVINGGSWCKPCFLSNKGLTASEQQVALNEMKALAYSKKGDCLSEEYVNSNTPLLWQCRNGHQWFATPSHVKHSNTWCSSCSVGNSERLCRILFEHIFQSPFPKKKPKWLLSPRNTVMELDGFSELSSIAFEYHGEQHYEQILHFHRGSQTLERRKSDDAHKALVCEKHGIKLFEIPHFIDKKMLFNYILDLARKLSVYDSVVSDNFNEESVDAHNDSLESMRDLAESFDGKCLSKVYVNNESKLLWKCKNGHTFRAARFSIQAGHWCPHCAGNAKLTIEDCKATAAEHGGKCLSESYINSKEHLLWECKNAHQWTARLDNIRSGKWCPTCSGKQKLTIGEMKAEAEKRGGQCLSDSYVNAHTRLRWRCAEGHQWDAKPMQIRRGRWCPTCGIKKAVLSRRFRLKKYSNNQ